MNIRELWSAVLDRVYPNDLYCICCGKIIDWSRTYRLCDSCMGEMKWATGRTCNKCGKPLSEVNPSNTCFNCREHSHVFDRGYTCTEYGVHERAIVYALKYDDRTDIADTLGEIMSDAMTARDYDLVVPVPITRKKSLERGYNQADLIARSLAKNTGLKYDGEVLSRVKETTAMRALSPDERRRNIEGSFALKPYGQTTICGAECLVIDDIYTTGATMDEIARVLKEGGARRVDFISFASGADMVKS